jgi:nitrile hydratase
VTARYSAGESVRISPRYPAEHHRVPNYVKGLSGTIERVCEAYAQPEGLAAGGDGEPRKTLYRVRIPQSEIWSDYDGAAHDQLEIEIFEHWLEKPNNT